jgi:hypothetical protein
VASRRVSSDLAVLRRQYERLGWRVHRTSKHLAWHGPNGERVVTSLTPSDRYAVDQMKRDLRRAMRHR